MTERDSTLDEIYRNWAAYQTLVVQALTPLDEAQIALRAAPHLRSIGEIAGHMVGARFHWCYGIMGERGEGWVTLAAEIERDPDPPAAGIVRAFERSAALVQADLERWSAADMQTVFRGNDRNGQPYADSRQWIIWHLIEHDLHHGGELSLTLGMHGLAAPDL